MSERLALYREKITTFWNRFSNKQKWMIAAIALFVVISLGLYIYFASRPVYVPLYDQRLSEQEVGMIKQELESAKVPYKITGNGTQIEVPEVQAQDVIVDLAAKGIPSQGTISSDIFKSAGTFGITDNQFKVLKKDALQEELRKMLEKVHGVQDAQVMITLPEENLWVTDKPENATASVIVNVEPGTQLNDQQIRSLYYIVSRSIDKLPIENITITDQYSNLLELSDTNDSNQHALSVYGQQEQMKTDVERKIQQNLYNLLGTLMGRDKVIVQTTVNMNFDKENRVENLVEPVDKENNEGIIISAEKLSKTFTGEGAPPAGAAGTGSSDVPSFPGGSQKGSNSNYEELEDRVNREVNRITRNITGSPYQIEDISINIGVEPPNGQQLDQQTIDNIKQILRNVVRVTVSSKNPQLTDQEIDQRISVFPRTFSGKVVAAEQQGLNPYILYGAGAVALLALGAVAYMLYRRRRQQKEIEEEIPDLSPSKPFEVPDLAYNEDNDEVIIRKQLDKLARSKPDEFVTLLRTWLAED